jgi:hypothetical protein
MKLHNLLRDGRRRAMTEMHIVDGYGKDVRAMALN